MSMDTEPIRLPAWVATLLTVVVIPVSAAWLTSVSVKAALATSLLALSPLLVAVEVGRRRIDPPAVVDAKIIAAHEQGLAAAATKASRRRTTK